MEVTTCDRALLLPPNMPKGVDGGLGRHAGVYDDAGRLVPGSVLKRRGKRVKRYTTFTAEGAPTIADEALFGGIWIPNFGHFLLETLARAWFLRTRPDLPVCWLAMSPAQADWQMALLGLLGLRNPVLLASRAAMVRRLLLPQPGFVMGAPFAAAQLDALTIAAGRHPVPGKRVWLSRTGLRDGLIADEPRIEAELAAAGWTVFRPEAHPIEQQLAMLADAERIAGFTGSAFHSLILFEGLRARIDLFCRTAELNDNYETIAMARGLDQHVHRPEVMATGGSGNATNHRLADPGFPVRLLLAGD